MVKRIIDIALHNQEKLKKQEERLQQLALEQKQRNTKKAYNAVFNDDILRAFADKVDELIQKVIDSKELYLSNTLYIKKGVAHPLKYYSECRRLPIDVNEKLLSLFSEIENKYSDSETQFHVRLVSWSLRTFGDGIWGHPDACAISLWKIPLYLATIPCLCIPACIYKAYRTEGKLYMKVSVKLIHRPKLDIDYDPNDQSDSDCTSTLSTST